MANWCYNVVTFDNPNVLEQLKNLFELMAAKEQQMEEGQLPNFIQNGEGYMFSINWETDTVSYETRWSPNIEVIKQIADYFTTGFNYYYEELGNLVYGEARYENGTLTDTFWNLLTSICLKKTKARIHGYLRGRNMKVSMTSLKFCWKENRISSIK